MPLKLQDVLFRGKDGVVDPDGGEDTVVDCWMVRVVNERTKSRTFILSETILKRYGLEECGVTNKGIYKGSPLQL